MSRSREAKTSLILPVCNTCGQVVLCLYAVFLFAYHTKMGRPYLMKVRKKLTDIPMSHTPQFKMGYTRENKVFKIKFFTVLDCSHLYDAINRVNYHTD